MARMNNQWDFRLEDLLEVVTQLLNNQPAPTVNPPTPSLSDFPQVDGELSFTEQEINQLQRVMEGLETEKDEVIETDGEAVTEDDLNTEQLRETLKQELKSELKEELKPKLLEAEETNFASNKQEGKTFKKELINYSSNYTPVEATIQSGQEITGVLCEVEADFIVIIDKNNHFIKIPVNKIIAIKKITDLNDDDQQTEKKEIAVEKANEEVADEVSLPAPEQLLARQLVTVEDRNKNT